MLVSYHGLRLVCNHILEHGAAMTIKHVANMPVDLFDLYREANKPVVITTAMDGWPARQLWDGPYLTAMLGEMMVEVSAWRDSNPAHEIQPENHKTNMRFADYIETLHQYQGKRFNDMYMTANNGFLRRPETQFLFEEMGDFPYFSAPRTGDNTFFWYGAAGTITQLHYDNMDIVLNQVMGSKFITLVPPKERPFLYNSIGVYSDVDCGKADMDKYPLYAQTDRQTLLLFPGESLFIPAGWWHYVRATDASISVSFTDL